MATKSISCGSYGSGTSNYTQYTSILHIGGGYRSRAKFSLDQIPSNAVINSVNLYMTHASSMYAASQGVAFSVATTGNWSYTTEGQTSVYSSQVSGNSYVWDITDVGEAMLAAGGNCYIHMSSSDPTDRPYSSVSVMVDYTVPPEITTPTLPEGTVGTQYSATISYTGTVTSWATGGSLPPGLSFTSGVLSGSPTTEGTYTFTVTAYNDGVSVSREYTVTIYSDVVAPDITTTTLPAGAVGVEYDQQISYTGSPGSLRIVGALPPGLGLYTDRIMGTPTAAGSYTFTIRVANSAGNDSAEYTVSVYEPIHFLTETLPDAVVGKPYTAEIQLGGSDQELRFRMQANGLVFPPGVSIDLSGSNPVQLQGTPTQAGDYGFRLVAINAVSSATRDFSIHVEPGTNIGYCTTDVYERVELYYSADGSSWVKVESYCEDGQTWQKLL